MIKIIPLTKERIKKFNIFGCDVSIGFAKYGEVLRTNKIFPNFYHTKNIYYLCDHEELDGVITHRLILWRVKINVKTVVKYDFKFA
jgi:hypothetical protein